MPDMAVDVAFTASDRIAKALDKMDRSVDRFGKDAQKSFKKANSGAKMFRSVMGGILAAGAVTKGLDLVKRGIVSVATSFIDLDQAATAAAVRFKDIGPNATNFKERLLEIKKVARDAGAVTEKSADEMAKSLDFLAKAGFKSGDAFAALIPLVNLSTATGEDFARVADIASDLMGSFGLNVKDPVQNLANLNNLLDVLTSTANSANVTVEDMFETMKQVGPVAKGILKIGLNEVAAATGLLGDNALKGTNAMTALKNIYLRLAAPASEGAKAMELLNIQMKDATGQPKKLGVVMGEINEALKNFDPTDKAGALNDLFGKRAIAGATIILNNLDKLEAKEKALAGVEGVTKQTADVLRTSVENRIKTLQSTLTELGLKIISPFEDDIKAGITRLTEFFRGLDVTPFVEGVKTIFDKIQTVNLEDFKDFPQKIADGIAAAIQGIKDFGATVERIWAKIEPIIDAINKTIEISQKSGGMTGSGFAGGKGLGGISDFLTGGDTPSQQDAAANVNNVNISQQIDVNAPKGTTATGTTRSAPGVKGDQGSGMTFAFGFN